MKPIHFLVLGQSNGANHGETPSASPTGLAFHKGTFMDLVDPIPGGSGKGGSVWTRVAPLLKSENITNQFVVTLMSEGGTSISDWANGGKCLNRTLSQMTAITACPIPVTHVFFHQGERDNLLCTTTQDYVKQFFELHEAIFSFIEAPWIICRASYRMGATSTQIIEAQNEIISLRDDFVAGPDTDQLGQTHRLDGTHFNDAGLLAFADQVCDTMTVFCRHR